MSNLHKILIESQRLEITSMKTFPPLKNPHTYLATIPRYSVPGQGYSRPTTGLNPAMWLIPGLTVTTPRAKPSPVHRHHVPNLPNVFFFQHKIGVIVRVPIVLIPVHSSFSEHTRRSLIYENVEPNRQLQSGLAKTGFSWRKICCCATHLISRNDSESRSQRQRIER